MHPASGARYLPRRGALQQATCQHTQARPGTGYQAKAVPPTPAPALTQRGNPVATVRGERERSRAEEGGPENRVRSNLRASLRTMGGRRKKTMEELWSLRRM